MNFTQVRVDRVPYVIQQIIGEEMNHYGGARLELIESIAEGMALRMHFLMNAVGEHEHTLRVSVPKTWWDHFKRDCFPDWLLRKYPEKYREVTKYVRVYDRVCPHKIDEIDKGCTNWLVYGTEA